MRPAFCTLPIFTHRVRNAWKMVKYKVSAALLSKMVKYKFGGSAMSYTMVIFKKYCAPLIFLDIMIE